MKVYYFATALTILFTLFTQAESSVDAERLLNYEIRRDTIYDSLLVNVTWYTSSTQETDSSPFITADNTHVRNGIIAISQDLMNIFAFGDSVYVDGIGWFEIHDLMHERWRKSIDIWCKYRYAAFRNGRQKRKIYWNYRNVEEYVFE